jgi:hypothetical protein
MPDARGFLMDAKLETVQLTTTDKKVATAGRLMSLDALRGFDMVWIIGGDRIVGGVFISLQMFFSKVCRVGLASITVWFTNWRPSRSSG